MKYFFTTLNLIVLVFVLFVSFSLGLVAQENYGQGTEASPLLIKNANDLYQFRDAVNSGSSYKGVSLSQTKGKYFRLENNIVLNFGYFEDYGDSWSEFGDAIGASTAFSGTFDGNAHYICGIYTTLNKDFGLFGTLKEARIKNLGIINSRYSIYTEKEITVGGLAASSSNSTIEDCFTDIDINIEGQDGWIGGLIGFSKEDNINKCFTNSNIDIKGNFVAANLVGQTQKSSISNSYNTGNISPCTKDEKWASIIGFCEYSKVENCYTIGDSERNAMIGGYNTNNYGEEGNVEDFLELWYLQTSPNDMEIEHSFRGLAFTTGMDLSYYFNNNILFFSKEVWRNREDNILYAPELISNPHKFGKDLVNTSYTKAVFSSKPEKTIYYLDENTLILEGGLITLFFGSDSIDIKLKEDYIKREDIDKFAYASSGEITLRVVFEEKEIGSFTVSKTNIHMPGLGESNPIEIKTKQDLLELAHAINSSAPYKDIDLVNNIVYFKITSDIELNEGYIHDTASWQEWTSIGSSQNPFKHNLDGNDKKITGIFRNPLFGSLSGASIKNLKIANSFICGENPAALASFSFGNSEILNIETSAIVKSIVDAVSTHYAAGIVSNIFGGIIENCKNYGEISGDYGAGGIAGFATNTEIRECLNTGKISSSLANGVSAGIVALLEEGTVEEVSNHGQIASNNIGAGIVGRMVNSNLNIAYNNAFVEGRSSAAGIVGYANTSYISNAYNTSSIKVSDGQCGGICANLNTGSLSNVYNIGAVNGSASFLTGNIIALPQNKVDISNAYFDSDILSQIRSENSLVVGLETEVFCSDTAIDFLGFNKEATLWNQILDEDFAYAYPILLNLPHTNLVYDIVVESLPNKTIYSIGESLSLDGGKLSLLYSGGKGKKESLDFSSEFLIFSELNSSQNGVQHISVCYTDPLDGRNLYTSFAVSIGAPVASISIARMPYKTVYALNQELDLSGALLAIEYTNGDKDTMPISPAMVSGFSSEKVATLELTVSFGSKTCSFSVRVVENLSNEDCLRETLAEESCTVYSNNKTIFVKFHDNSSKVHNISLFHSSGKQIKTDRISGNNWKCEVRDTALYILMIDGRHYKIIVL